MLGVILLLLQSSLLLFYHFKLFLSLLCLEILNSIVYFGHLENETLYFDRSALLKLACRLICLQKLNDALSMNRVKTGKNVEFIAED